MEENIGICVGVIAIIFIIYLYYSSQQYSEPVTILWFYSEKCGHCIRMAHAWNKFVEMAPPVTLKKIDIVENKEMADSYGVNGVPYIVKIGRSKMSVYRGDRSADDLYRFATSD